MNTRRITGTVSSYEKILVANRVPHWTILLACALFFAGAATVTPSRGQQAPKPTPKPISKPKSTPASASAATPAPAINPPADTGQLDRDAILHHLNAVITWYRDITSKVKPVGLPSDAIYQDNTRSLASEAVRLAFQSARAEAAIISAMNKPDKIGAAAKAPDSSQPQPNNGQPTQQQNLAQTAAKIAAQIDDTQTKLDAVNKELASATRSKQKDLLVQRDRLQGLLTLNKALQDTIQKMASFVGGATESAEGLEGSIDQLAHSVPEVLGDDTKKSGTAATAAVAATAASAKPVVSAAPSGLIGQSLTLFDQMQTMHQIEQMATETQKMRATADEIRKPLRDVLVATIKQGRDLANQAQTPPAANAAPNSAYVSSSVT